MIDMQTVQHRITRNYRGHELPPPPALRHLISARARRLPKAPTPDECPPLPACTDPYLMQFYYADQLLTYPTTILQGVVTCAANTRSRTWLGNVEGPARLQTLTFMTTQSGPTTSTAINIQLANQHLPDLTDDADTTFVPGPWLFTSLTPIRGLIGLCMTNYNHPVTFPINTPIPPGNWHLHAWKTDNLGARPAYITLTICPTYCGPDPDTTWPEALTLPPDLDRSDPIGWFASAAPTLTSASRYWSWHQHRWNIALAAGPTVQLDFLPRYLSQLPRTYLIPHYPPAPGTVSAQRYQTSPNAWIPWPEARS